MASPIPFSQTDIERRRLELTIDGDLGDFTFSSTSIPTTSSSDFNPPPQPFLGHNSNHSNSDSFISALSSNLSLEYPRAESVGITPTTYHHPGQHIHGVGAGYRHGNGPSGTPRVSARMTSRMSSFGAGAESMFIGASPASTAGHHASAVTLGAGIFKGHRGGKEQEESYGDYDPERSMGGLVREIKRTTGEDTLQPRPTSPFSPHRSPSPLPSTSPHPLNLSYTLSRNDPLLSPPSSGEGTLKPKRRGVDSPSHFSSYAREIDADLLAARQAAAPDAAPKPKAARRPLGETSVHNVSRTPGQRKAAGKEKGDRVRGLQGEWGKSASAPVRRRMDYTADITGLTALMATPAKGGQFGQLGANVDVGGDPAMDIPESLAAVQARIRALETENSVNRRRVKELEGEVERVNEDLVKAKRLGGRELQEAISEKSDLEQLVRSLRESLAGLTLELEHNKALVAELREDASSRPDAPSSHHDSPFQSDLDAIRNDVERLTHKVEHIGNMVEQQLDSRKRARGERTLRMEKDEMERLVQQVVDQENDDIRRAQADVERRLAALTTAQSNHPLPSRIRQGLHATGSVAPGLAPPSAPLPQMQDVSQNPTPPLSDHGAYDSPTPASRPGSRQNLLVPDRTHKTARQDSKSRRRSSRPMHEGAGPGSPFPSIVGEDLEKEFFSPLKERKTKQMTQPERAKATEDWATALRAGEKVAEKPAKLAREQDDLPAKVKVSREISETEERLAHMKTVYSEVSDQYKVLDPASIRSKRHALADHLRDIIDEMEVLSDRISNLYDTLSFYDPLLSREGLDMRERRGTGNGQLRGKSIGAIVDMVKGDLGEEAYERLRRDTKRN